jgi:hypothetical protein
MKLPHLFCAFVVLVFLCETAPSVRVIAQQQPRQPSEQLGRSSPISTGSDSVIGIQLDPITSLDVPFDPDRGRGIREEIPDKYRERYLAWRSEFLATEIGRRQWSTYAQSTGFTLTITISKDRKQGAMTGKYKWSDSGELIAATITLGNQIDEGYPDPIYYPVMNSLRLGQGSRLFGGNLLAAAKIAHEFGHVNRASSADGKLYQLQNQLMPIYKRIFLNNGHDVDDPRLKSLAIQMGGTSLEIWEDREYWGEANAMLFLRDRISKQRSRCVIFSKIRQSVQKYAIGYAERFRNIAQSDPGQCDWD